MKELDRIDQQRRRERHPEAPEDSAFLVDAMEGITVDGFCTAYDTLIRGRVAMSNVDTVACVKVALGIADNDEPEVTALILNAIAEANVAMGFTGPPMIYHALNERRKTFIRTMSAEPAVA